MSDTLPRKPALALSIPPSDVDIKQAFFAFSVHSVVALKVRNWITCQIVFDVPVHKFMSGKTVPAIEDISHLDELSEVSHGQSNSLNQDTNYSTGPGCV